MGLFYYREGCVGRRVGSQESLEQCFGPRSRGPSLELGGKGSLEDGDWALAGEFGGYIS